MRRARQAIVYPNGSLDSKRVEGRPGREEIAALREAQGRELSTRLGSRPGPPFCALLRGTDACWDALGL